MKADDVIKNTLGEHVFEKFVEGKMHEWDEFRTSVKDSCTAPLPYCPNFSMLFDRDILFAYSHFTR